MSQVQEALGAACAVGYFEDADLTPEFDYYYDDVKDGFQRTPDETLPPTSELNDKYVSENVFLSRENDVLQGRVCKLARDKYGNPIGRAN